MVGSPLFDRPWQGARELHDLGIRRDPDSLSYAIEMARLHETGLSELIYLAAPLVERLNEFWGTRACPAELPAW